MFVADRQKIPVSPRSAGNFASNVVDLQTLIRQKQKAWRPYSKVFKTARRRIETVSPQLCDQMMFKRNYVKSFMVLQ